MASKSPLRRTRRRRSSRGTLSNISSAIVCSVNGGRPTPSQGKKPQREHARRPYQAQARASGWTLCIQEATVLADVSPQPAAFLWEIVAWELLIWELADTIYANQFTVFRAAAVHIVTKTLYQP